MKRKQNIYFDRKSMGFKLGKRPLSKEEKRKQSAIRKQQKAHERMMAADERKRAKKEASSLFKQLQKDAKPSRKSRTHKPRWTPEDEAGWQELLKSNPNRVFPGNLTPTEISALRKLAAKGNTMASKKRRKKKNSRNGKMPAGLAAYWRKKRAKKNPRKKKARRKVRVITRYRTRTVTKIKRYRRKRKSNPRRKRPVKIIKTNLRKGTKAFNRFVAEQRAKYGTARVL